MIDDLYDELTKEILIRKLYESFPGMKEEYEEIALVGYSLGWSMALASARDFILRQIKGVPSKENGPPVGLIKKCAWKDEGEYWESSCGLHFSINEGTPEDNGMTHCGRCGKEIE